MTNKDLITFVDYKQIVVGGRYAGRILKAYLFDNKFDIRTLGIVVEIIYQGNLIEITKYVKAKLYVFCNRKV